jgi:hypothetical protein
MVAQQSWTTTLRKRPIGWEFRLIRKKRRSPKPSICEPNQTVHRRPPVIDLGLKQSAPASIARAT